MMQKMIKQNLNLSEIKKGNKKHVLHNIEMLYKARNSVIEFFDDYSLMVPTQNLKQLKEQHLFPKQML